MSLIPLRNWLFKSELIKMEIATHGKWLHTVETALDTRWFANDTLFHLNSKMPGLKVIGNTLRLKNFVSVIFFSGYLLPLFGTLVFHNPWHSINSFFYSLYNLYIYILFERAIDLLLMGRTKSRIYNREEQIDWKQFGATLKGGQF